MSARRKKSTAPTETVSIRLPSDQVRLFEIKAAGANMYRGTYIALRLLEEEPEPWPSLAALARIVAIHDAILASRTITTEQLDELRTLLREFAQIARKEVLR